MKKTLSIWVSIVSVSVVLVMIITFAYGLFFASNPKEIPSALIGKPAQIFQLVDFNGNEFSKIK